MLQAVIGNFTQMKGRPPTELELVAIMNQLNARIADVDSDEDSDVDEDELAAENDAEAQSGDEEDDEDEEDEDEDEDEDEEEANEEEMPAAAPPASAGSAARRPRKSHRASVEGTPGLRSKGASAPLPPAPIIRKRRAGKA